ncbi:6-phospho-beta-galactosidase [Dissostichus eleginoides]|uniref:6-phospho-beta-galactosidase n=1 Tax=Dissostichus eleginoides TaxID=100907 RepID=A0AAD9FGU5_DISEL|nr:6-phospho-beta-galactosidase [Dissostichus eleginoides]
MELDSNRVYEGDSDRLYNAKGDKGKRTETKVRGVKGEPYEQREAPIRQPVLDVLLAAEYEIPPLPLTLVRMRGACSVIITIPEVVQSVVYGDTPSCCCCCCWRTDVQPLSIPRTPRDSPTHSRTEPHRVRPNTAPVSERTNRRDKEATAE